MTSTYSSVRCVAYYRVETCCYFNANAATSSTCTPAGHHSAEFAVLWQHMYCWQTFILLLQAALTPCHNGLPCMACEPVALPLHVSNSIWGVYMVEEL